MERLSFQLLIAKSFVFLGAWSQLSLALGGLHPHHRAPTARHRVANFKRYGQKTTITETNDDK
jgi:hypothetical protein